MRALARLWEEGLRLLFAPSCRVCGAHGWEPWCEACEQSVEPLPGPACALCSGRLRVPGVCQACRRAAPLYDGMVCRFAHGGALREALYLLKFGRQRRLGERLGSLLAQGLVLPADWRVQVVVPVPLHPRRRLERGFNQAELLAGPVAQALGLPLEPARLRRQRATRPQYQTAAADRSRNVRGAFVANGVEGRTVLLVDDIVTSGATLNACAAALRQDGARTVYVLALARVVRPVQSKAA